MKIPRSELLDIFVGKEIYYTGVLHTQMQRSSKTVLVAAIFPEQSPGVWTTPFNQGYITIIEVWRSLWKTGPPCLAIFIPLPCPKGTGKGG
jgi:hypothetical protein